MISDILYSTSRLNLKLLDESDSDLLYQINQDPKVMEFFPALISKENTLKFITDIKEHYTKYGYTMYGCYLKNNNEFIGIVGLYNRPNDLPCSPCVEVGWRIGCKYWGQGYAVEAAQKCLEIGFNQFNLQEIVSFTASVNYRSERVMQKLGMQHDTKRDFMHPRLDKDSILCAHVFYFINKYIFRGT